MQIIVKLAEETAINILKNPGNWTSFFKTASWNYKYQFQNQLLIYAQHPDATVCAPIEVWNRKLGRWVNKGAKGLALIDDSGDRLTLRYVFDISDTNSRDGLPVILWSVRDSYADVIIETLESTFRELDEKSDLPAALISAANNAVDDNFQDYLSDLMDCWEGGPLFTFRSGQQWEMWVPMRIPAVYLYVCRAASSYYSTTI